MTAIPASSMRCRTMADGTLRIELDIEPRNAQAAFSLFGAPGTAVALAALKTDAQQEQAKPKGGPASQWLALRCKEPAFRIFLAEHYNDAWRIKAPILDLSDRAAAAVRHICDVDSRADIDNDKAAFQRFETLIRKPYLEATRDG